MQKTTVDIYESLAALYITVLIVSNIASIKLVGAGPLIFDAGTILFPLAYIVGDIIAEVYGFRKLRALLYIGIVMLLITSLTFWVVGLLPAAAGWSGQESYDAVLGVVWRIILASITAIFVGELTNAYVLTKLKIRLQGRRLWARIVGSTALGSVIDTTVFSLIAFAGMISGGDMLKLIATVFAIKILTEILVSPLTVRVIRYIKKRENIDVYEEPSLRLS